MTNDPICNPSPLGPHAFDSWESRIAAQNDAFRKALGACEWQGQELHGRLFVGRRIRARSGDFKAAVLFRVQIYEFPADTSPLDMRSAGTIETTIEGERLRVLWKIDVRNRHDLNRSCDPSYPAECTRTLDVWM